MWVHTYASVHASVCACMCAGYRITSGTIHFFFPFETWFLGLCSTAVKMPCDRSQRLQRKTCNCRPACSFRSLVQYHHSGWGVCWEHSSTQGALAVAKKGAKSEGERLGLAWAFFETSKPTPSVTLPSTRPYLSEPMGAILIQTTTCNLSVAWNSPSRLSWLVIKSQGSSCLCFPTAGLISTHCHTRVFDVGSRDIIRVLHLLSHLPNPMLHFS